MKPPIAMFCDSCDQMVHADDVVVLNADGMLPALAGTCLFCTRFVSRVLSRSVIRMLHEVGVPSIAEVMERTLEV